MRTLKDSWKPVFAVGILTVLLVAGQSWAEPHFLIDSEDQWNDAAAGGHVQPVMPSEWTDYMDQWSLYLEEGDPYPSNMFSSANLYVWGGGGGGGADPEDAGLVMVWDDYDGPGSYSSAWKWDYGVDPDLSNSIINVTVTAPDFVNVVSFGVRSGMWNGPVRAWAWNVGPGGPILPWTPTQITIDMTQIGVGAATPVATSYMNNPGFNPANSLFFIFDENVLWNWVGDPCDVPVPPPGQLIPDPWNYWHDLVVTPKIDPKPLVTKWSQPPVEYYPGEEPPTFYGWDERSLHETPPMVADDWLCTDQRPITDIHWWGSFIGWDQPYPPTLPAGFHITIWSDMAADDPDNQLGYSHPEVCLWENYCYSYEYNFAGWDYDPRGQYWNEACFQFNQYLPLEEWFYQDPYEDPDPELGGTVYWLGITAIYQISQPEYPWGWKTRPHFFNDDAVRFSSNPWPPFPGATFAFGYPIEFPEGVSWDLAFELTTEDEPCQPDPKHDLGDAPDSTNNFAPTVMTAYPSGGPPGVIANFPTVFATGSPPHGPIHWQPRAVAYLGAGVSLEDEADLMPDEDGLPNLDPPGDQPDQDQFDDGVLLHTLVMRHCVCTTFDYEVTVVDASQPLYFNAWFDWTLDGDWDDTPECPDAALAPEWAVQNQALTFTAPGTYTITTPTFRPHLATAASTDHNMWLRATLSEQPWSSTAGIAGDGGSGPATGHQYGETEDYYIMPWETQACCLTDGTCQDIDEMGCLMQAGIPQGAGTQCITTDCTDDCDWGPEPAIKWLQEPNAELSGLHCHNSPTGGEIVLAEDWLCQGGVVTDLHWWGNYEYYGTNGIDHFHLSVHRDIPDPDPADPRTWSRPATQPGGGLIEIDVPIALCHERASGLMSPSGQPIYEYTYYLDEPFDQIAGEVYWFNLTARSLDGSTVWRWNEMARSHWDDKTIDAAVDWRPFNLNWEQIRWDVPPIGYDPCDTYSEMAFAVTSTPTWPENTKVVQLPDVSQYGIDIDVDDTAGVHHNLADDFLCTQRSTMEDIHFWGSWLGDVKGEIEKITVSFYSDVAVDDPCNHSGYSHPGRRLWQRVFGPGEFNEEIHATLPNQEGEWWWDPLTGDIIPNADWTVWQVNICLDPCDPCLFIQRGHENVPFVYWLGIEVDSQCNPEFGWKTRDIDDGHFNDNAVYWDPGAGFTGQWRELVYPPGHPYGLLNMPLDLSFVLVGRPLPMDIPWCWLCDTQCHGDCDCDGDVDTVDWPTFRDSFGSSYGDPDYNPCGDMDRDGDVDTVDWPEFRDNFGGPAPGGCPIGGTWPPGP